MARRDGPASDARHDHRALAILGAVFILLEIVSLTGITPGPHTALHAEPVNRFFSVALFTSFLFHLRQRPRAAEIGLAIAIGAIAPATSILGAMRGPKGDLVAILAMGLGEGSLIVLAGKTLLAEGDARAGAFERLARASLLPLFVAVTLTGFALSSALHPATYDGAVLHLDAALGGHASFALGRVLAAIPILQPILALVVAAIPLAIAVSTQDRALPNLLESVVFAGLAGLAIHHACPVAGPAALFGDLFPFGISSIAIADVPITPYALSPAFARKGVLSLHVAWSLLLFWHARSRGPKVQLAAGIWLFLTLFATLGLGEHDLVDLVITVPFAVAIHAATTRAIPISSPHRARALLVGAAFTLTWILLIRNGVAVFERARPVLWLLVIATVAIPLALRRDLERAGATMTAALVPLDEAAPLDPAARSLARTIAILFFCSGFSGLVYEVVFEKSLALTFGNTAQASATVLATYMGGMALGAWAGGRIGAKARDALRVYALSELGIALVCAISPLLFALIRAAYVALATGVHGGHLLIVAQVALGSAIMLPATFLMGITMPVLARELLGARGSLGSAVSMLYGANTLGAASGALLTGYFILPFLGIARTTWLAVALNVLVALVARRMAARRSETAKPLDTRTAHATTTHQDAADPARATEPRIALAILIGGGAITLALEVTYTHLLAVVAGNSVYAFALMLFTFLIGLGAGAALIRPLLRRGPLGIAVVGAIEVGLALAILAGVWVWESIPAYFASFAGYPATTQFGQREIVRFLVCVVAMAPPSIAIGALYPAAMACAAQSHPRGPIAALGRASALNTAGNIAGALAASFLLLPRLGSLTTLHTLAAVAVALGGLPILANVKGTRVLLAPLAATSALFLAQPEQFDLDRLASGANVYFTEQGFGKVIDAAESVSGGITTVVSRQSSDGAAVSTLLTNGKFQGDDSPHNEMPAQFGFALCPLLHTNKRDNALVIGFGTGGTCRVMRDAGFGHTDVAELSEDILHLADKHFRIVNDGVLAAPEVTASVTDGRHHLLVHDRRYDLISIEISSIWFAGAASLYNRDFYALAKTRLAPGGVLQQWIQLHHLSPRDIVSALATVRAEMPFVRLYVVGAQGMIVACVDDCPVRPETIEALDASPRLRDVLAIYGGSVQRIADGLALDPRGVEKLLASWVEGGVPLDTLLSTDDNMLLEYATPRGNVMPHWESLASNLTVLGLRKAPKGP